MRQAYSYEETWLPHPVEESELSTSMIRPPYEGVLEMPAALVGRWQRAVEEFFDATWEVEKLIAAERRKNQ